MAEHAKGEARTHVGQWLATTPRVVAWIRVNNRSDLLVEDLAMARDSGALGVIMPKADPTSCDHDGLRVIALIESAVGVASLAAIAALPSVVRLALGEADLAADLGMQPSPDGRELAPIRSAVVVASAAAGLAAPVGPVHTDLSDDDGLAMTSAVLVRHGFGGRSAIHPRQIPLINEAFTPSVERVAWAEAVIAAHEDAGGAGATVDGEFVDAAVVRRAWNILARVAQ